MISSHNQIYYYFVDLQSILIPCSLVMISMLFLALPGDEPVVVPIKRLEGQLGLAGHLDVGDHAVVVPEQTNTN